MSFFAGRDSPPVKWLDYNGRPRATFSWNFINQNHVFTNIRFCQIFGLLLLSYLRKICFFYPEIKFKIT